MCDMLFNLNNDILNHINKDITYKRGYNNVIKSLKDINNDFNKDLILNNKGFLSPTYNYDNHYTFYYMIMRDKGLKVKRPLMRR